MTQEKAQNIVSMIREFYGGLEAEVEYNYYVKVTAPSGEVEHISDEYYAGSTLYRMLENGRKKVQS